MTIPRLQQLRSDAIRFGHRFVAGQLRSQGLPFEATYILLMGRSPRIQHLRGQSA